MISATHVAAVTGARIRLGFNKLRVIGISGVLYKLRQSELHAQHPRHSSTARRVCALRAEATRSASPRAASTGVGACAGICVTSRPSSRRSYRTRALNWRSRSSAAQFTAQGRAVSSHICRVWGRVLGVKFKAAGFALTRLPLTAPRRSGTHSSTRRSAGDKSCASARRARSPGRLRGATSH